VIELTISQSASAVGFFPKPFFVIFEPADGCFFHSFAFTPGGYDDWPYLYLPKALRVPALSG
jgi:hypothetical protein